MEGFLQQQCSKQNEKCYQDETMWVLLPELIQ